MSVANTKSTIVTARDAGNAVVLRQAGASTFEAVATVEVASADDDNSVYRLFRVASNASLRSFDVLNDAITGGTAYDLGLYDTEENGGAAVDADLYADGVSMATARSVPASVLFTTLGVEDIEKTIWQQLGLSADPHVEYDLAITATTVGSAAGTLSARLQWVGSV